MNRIDDAMHELLTVFESSQTKYEANERAAPVLEQLSYDDGFLRQLLQRYLETPGALDQKNYPVVSIPVGINSHFHLVAHCWVPLPGRATHLSTKAIHHHGDLLLSSVTVFGPGYEHWMFTLPEPIDAERGLYRMSLLEAAAHPRHHVAFVDCWTAHTPMYPPSLSITLALWTNRHPLTWRDRVKRWPAFKGRENQLRQWAVKLGLKGALQLKVVDGFDFFPTPEGFQVMRERREFGRGPIEDHVCSVFHVLQQTGNEQLATTIERSISAGLVHEGRACVEECLRTLRQGTPIDGRLSEGHFGQPYANFTRDDMRQALAAGKP